MTVQNKLIFGVFHAVPVCVLFIIAYMTGGVAGSTKKVGFSAVYQIGYAVGNIIGPQTYVSADAPNYYVGASGERFRDRTQRVR